MALKDNPGVMTMPRTERDWTKFINDLSDNVQSSVAVTDSDESTESLNEFYVYFMADN